MLKVILGLLAIATFPAAALATEPYPDGVVPCLKGSCADGSSPAPVQKSPNWQNVRTTPRGAGIGLPPCQLCDHPYRVRLLAGAQHN
jgi:hypothetical protein